MTTSEWRANDDEPVRSALDDLMSTLAAEISNDLKPIQLSLDRPLEAYMVFVMPMAKETKNEPAAVLVPPKSLSPLEKETYAH